MVENIQVRTKGRETSDTIMIVQNRFPGQVEGIKDGSYWRM